MVNHRAALALALFALGPATASARQPDCRITRDAYDTVTHGTSYRQVVSIFGCPGRRVTHMTIGKVRRTTYTWRGTGRTGANLTLSFRDGRLTSKAQLGLP